MRHVLTPTSYQDQQQRRSDKLSATLDFLAGEQWSTLDMLADMLSVSRRNAGRVVAALEREGAVVADPLVITDARRLIKINILGITGHGQALAGRWDVQEYQRGQVSPHFAMHHLATQQARLAAEAAGWRDWAAGKSLYGKGFKKVPDALVTSPAGQRIAIEIERNVKSPKRYAEAMVAAISDIRQKRFDVVHYISPAGQQALIERAQAKVTVLHFKGEVIPTVVEQKHRLRFLFFSLDAWPPK